jgi:F420H(2)-dependent quinone reductase
VNLLRRAAAVVNAAVRPLVAGGLFGGWMTVLTYTGRRSGRTFSIPVGYTRRDDELTIRVALPDRKSWWRNFLDEDGPVTVRLRGVDTPGHARAARTPAGQVTVTVRLE